MKIDLTSDEAQALLDGINVVIKELAKDVAWVSEAIPLSTSGRDQRIADLRQDLAAAKSAREKLAS